MIAITKNSREERRIERQSYMGRDLINPRVWYDDGSGEYRPGKQGIAIRTELVGEVIEALGETVSLKEVA